MASVVEQKIKVFALGGLDENGKNLYVVEVNDKIFILDAGLKYPTEDLLGVDAVIPDFTYLKENASRIQGVFLSHGHEDHIGAIPQLLSIINLKAGYIIRIYQFVPVFSLDNSPQCNIIKLQIAFYTKIINI